MIAAAPLARLALMLEAMRPGFLSEPEVHAAEMAAAPVDMQEAAAAARAWRALRHLAIRRLVRAERKTRGA